MRSISIFDPFSPSQSHPNYSIFISLFNPFLPYSILLALPTYVPSHETITPAAWSRSAMFSLVYIHTKVIILVSTIVSLYCLFLSSGNVHPIASFNIKASEDLWERGRRKGEKWWNILLFGNNAMKTNMYTEYNGIRRNVYIYYIYRFVDKFVPTINNKKHHIK